MERWTFSRSALFVAMHKKSNGFSCRGPDRVSEEIVTVLTKESSLEFKALFLIVHANLKSRNAAGGGEEILRLRAYEKLQNLVQVGVVNKTGKEYTGVASALVTFMEAAAEWKAKAALRIQCRPFILADKASALQAVSTGNS
jgi:hypothetical protein